MGHKKTRVTPYQIVNNNCDDMSIHLDWHWMDGEMDSQNW